MAVSYSYAARTPVTATHAAAIDTIAAVASVRPMIGLIFFSYSAAPTGGRLLIQDDAATTLFDLDITAAGEHRIEFPGNGLRIGSGKGFVVTLADGGVAIVGKLNVFTVQM